MFYEKTLKTLLAKILRRLGITNHLRYYFKLSFGKNKLKIPMSTPTGNIIMEELIKFKPSFKTFLLEILKVILVQITLLMLELMLVKHLSKYLVIT